MTRQELDELRGDIQEKINILTRQDESVVAKYLSEHHLNAFLGTIVQVGEDLPFQLTSFNLDGKQLVIYGHPLRKNGDVAGNVIKKVVDDDDTLDIHDASHIAVEMHNAADLKTLQHCAEMLHRQKTISRGYIHYRVMSITYTKLWCIKPLWLTEEERVSLYTKVWGSLKFFRFKEPDIDTVVEKCSLYIKLLMKAYQDKQDCKTKQN